MRGAKEARKGFGGGRGEAGVRDWRQQWTETAGTMTTMAGATSGRARAVYDSGAPLRHALFLSPQQCDPAAAVAHSMLCCSSLLETYFFVALQMSSLALL